MPLVELALLSRKGDEPFEVIKRLSLTQKKAQVDTSAVMTPSVSTFTSNWADDGGAKSSGRPLAWGDDDDENGGRQAQQASVRERASKPALRTAAMQDMNANRKSAFHSLVRDAGASTSSAWVEEMWKRVAKSHANDADMSDATFDNEMRYMIERQLQGRPAEIDTSSSHDPLDIAMPPRPQPRKMRVPISPADDTEDAGSDRTASGARKGRRARDAHGAEGEVHAPSTLTDEHASVYRRVVAWLKRLSADKRPSTRRALATACMPLCLVEVRADEKKVFAHLKATGYLVVTSNKAPAPTGTLQRRSVSVTVLHRIFERQQAERIQG
jgi:hypothetical protein